MNSVFNTPFEISMRVLFVLLADEKPKTIDMIAAIDFISVYGKAFGIAEENLHGDNFYKYGEFTARRAIVKKAIFPLLQNEMLDVYEKEDGYYFQANDAGEEYCFSLTSEYAIEYAKTSKAAVLYVGMKSDSEIIREIMTQSTIGLRSGGRYE